MIFLYGIFEKIGFFPMQAIPSAADDIDILKCSEIYQGFIKDVVFLAINFT